MVRSSSAGYSGNYPGVHYRYLAITARPCLTQATALADLKTAWGKSTQFSSTASPGAGPAPEALAVSKSFTLGVPLATRGVWPGAFGFSIFTHGRARRLCRRGRCQPGIAMKVLLYAVELFRNIEPTTECENKT